MKSQSKHFWFLLILLVIGGMAGHLWERAGEAHIERRALKDFPTELGTWKQRGADMRFDAATEAILRAHDYVMRDYAQPGGRPASLYVGYYATQRSGALYHSPRNCLPGAGWVMGESATVQITPANGGPTFEANRYIVQNGDSKQFLVYWYQGRGRAVASEYWDKFYTVMDSVRRRRSDGAMVRVMMPVDSSEETALAAATELAAQVSPHLHAFVPD